MANPAEIEIADVGEIRNQIDHMLKRSEDIRVRLILLHDYPDGLNLAQVQVCVEEMESLFSKLDTLVRQPDGANQGDQP